MAAVCSAALAAAAPASAGEGSLPSVSSGERPGPPVLYSPLPQVPQLSLQPPFAADPLLVSGTDAYRGGEYLYQDYLFDDHGADTVAGSGNRGEPGQDIAAPTAGDVLYPTADRFASNAADIVELRIRPTAEAIVHRVTLNTVKADDATVVGIGIDTDRGGGSPVAWPLGAGVSSPGLDAFVTAFGTGAKLTRLPGGETTDLPAGSVSIDRTTNQMTIRVPRSLLDPGTATWRYVAGAGLWSGTGWVPVPAASEPTEERPASGDSTEDAPAVFNLAFRFDEPTIKSPTPPFTTFPGTGNWFEDRQAQALKDRTTGGFFADVDFGKLAAGADEQLHRPAGSEQARILASRLDLPEGVRGFGERGDDSDGTSDTFPRYGGRLQPYLLTVPPGLDRSRPAGLTFALHSLGATYTQYAVFSPNQLRQFGDQRGNLVATPLARGTDGWYTDEAEVDVFEVWADVAARFPLDPERVAITGYSMGGYGTYKLGVEYPDLFGRAFTTVGPPARGIWIPPARPSGGASTNTNPLLENVRWIPYLNWAQLIDELVPYPGPLAQQARFDELGLRSQLWTFTPGEHFTLAILDEWGAARDFLGDARVVRDPWRVNYAFMPAADRPKLGLVHDHAYWVSGLRVRDASGDPDTDPARGEIDARSLAFGQGEPETAPVTSAAVGPGTPAPAAVDGTRWTDVAQAPAENALEMTLENVGAGTIDGRRARLDGGERLRVRVTSDGSGELRLELPLARGASVERTGGEPVAAAARRRASRPARTAAGRRASARARTAAAAPEVALDRRGATFRVAAGTRTYVIEPPEAAGAERRRSPGDRRDGARAGREDGPRDVAGTTGGDSLPFTGLELALLALGGLALAGGGAALRRRAA